MKPETMAASDVCRGAAATPLVSIVTVVRNAAEAIEPTLRSVFENGSRPLYEFIVIDGASSDGTLERIRAYADRLDYWVSEPDRGIYDAMNKGIAAARGEFIYHLNVGDRLLALPTAELQQALAENVDIAAFRVSIDGRREFLPSGGRSLRHNNTIHHQGAFYRRKSFPGYNADYRVFADFDVNQRLLFSGARLACYGRVVAYHSSDGVSNRSGAREFFRIIRRNCGPGAMMAAFLKCKYRGAVARWPFSNRIPI